MAIILRQEIDNTILAVWKTEESLEEISILDSAQPYLADLDQFSSDSRKLEWLIVRVLLFELLQEHKHISYKTNGKPYIKDSIYQISISHTKGFVAIYLSTKTHIGVDIEYINNRVERIAHRVFSQEELNGINKDTQFAQLIVMWCSKETIFKAFDLSEVDFIKHLKIHPFQLNTKSGKLIGQELQTRNTEYLDISYIINEEFVLTYGQKKCPDEFTSAGHSK